MVRIQPNKNPDNKAQELLAGVKQKLGSTPNVFKTLAQSSTALNFFLTASAALNASKLSSSLREQIALTVAGANACDYCASAHTAIGKMQMISENELAQNLQGNSNDGKTQAALKFARKIVDLRGNVSDADLADIRSAGFSDGEIVDIIAVVSLNLFTNYFNHIAGTDVDFPLVSASQITANI